MKLDVSFTEASPMTNIETNVIWTSNFPREIVASQFILPGQVRGEDSFISLGVTEFSAGQWQSLAIGKGQ